MLLLTYLLIIVFYYVVSHRLINVGSSEFIFFRLCVGVLCCCPLVTDQVATHTVEYRGHLEFDGRRWTERPTSSASADDRHAGRSGPDPVPETFDAAEGPT